jgi:hypothetical protein
MWGVYQAITAEPVELKQMTFDVEPAFPRQFFFHLGKAAIGKIDNFAAPRANQMMVMLRRSSHHVTPAPAFYMDPAHQVEFTQKIKSAVNSNPPDTRVFYPRLLIYDFWSQMVTARGHSPEHDVALRGKLVPMLPENSRYLIGRKFHIVRLLKQNIV